MFLFRRTSVGDNLVYTDWKKDNYIEAIKQTLGKEAKGIKIYVTNSPFSCSIFSSILNIRNPYILYKILSDRRTKTSNIEYYDI